MAREELRERIDFLEETYEFLLSYAARGLPGDEGVGGELRRNLGEAEETIARLGDLFRKAVDEDEEFRPRDPYESYAEVLEADAEATLSALRVVLAQPSISSQMVDNLNASIHFRALLTDLFLVDELLKPRRAEAASG